MCQWFDPLGESSRRLSCHEMRSKTNQPGNTATNLLVTISMIHMIQSRNTMKHVNLGPQELKNPLL